MSSSSSDRTAGGLGGIVVGVDGSPPGEQALRWAARQAGLTGQQVHAVIAWDVPVSYGVAAVGDVDWRGDAAAVLQKVVANVVPEEDRERVEQHVLRGHPAKVLADAAADADLLVVGCRGHGGFAGMLVGSVSQHVVAHAACPVVVVHDGTSHAAATA